MKPVLEQPWPELKYVRALRIPKANPRKATTQDGYQKLFMSMILEKRCKKFGRKQGMDAWQNGRRNAGLQQNHVKTRQTEHTAGEA